MTTGRRRTKGDGQTASGADDWNPLGTEAKVYFPSCLRAESVGAELSCFRFFTSRHLEVWKKLMGKRKDKVDYSCTVTGHEDGKRA